VAASSFLSLKGRVARVLLTLAEEFGREVGQGCVVIQQKVSQDDLAASARLDETVAAESSFRLLLPGEQGPYETSNQGSPGRTPPHFAAASPKK